MPINDRTLKGSTETYLLNEFRAINAHVPRKRKALAELLDEDHPCVTCGDGSTHFFKKGELRLLAGMLEQEDRENVLLPMLVEVSSGRNEYSIPSPMGTEAKILSNILEMETACTMHRIAIFRPHLSIIRRKLKTCTQYVFIP